MSRRRKLALGAALALLLYAAIGFLLLPWIVRTQAVETLREELERDASIGDVRINPFLLSIDVRDFVLPDRDGSDFVRFDELFVDFELSSLYHFAFTFREIRLESASIHVKVLDDGALNFGDIIDTLLAEDESAAEEEPGGPPPLLIHLARIDSGRIAFTDYSRPTDFEAEISPLDIELRDFGTRPDDESPYSFKATTGAGEALEWEGSLSVVPLYSQGRFALTGVRPRTGWLYVQDDVHFEVVSGTVDVLGRYDLDARDALSARLDEGEIRVRNFRVADRESGDVAVAVAALDVTGIEVAYPEQRVHVAAVEGQGGRHHLVRLADGRFRMQRLSETRSAQAAAGDTPAVSTTAGAAGDPRTASAAAGTETPPAAATTPPPTAPSTEAPPWSFAIDRVEITHHRIDFEDRSTEPVARLAIAPIAVRVDDITSDPTRPIDFRLDLGFGEDAQTRAAPAARAEQAEQATADSPTEEKGRLVVNGSVTPEPAAVKLDVDLSRFDLTPFEPYWLPTLAVHSSSARLGIDAELDVRAPREAPLQLRFAGDVRVDELATFDERLSEPLLSWKALELAGLGFELEPMSVTLDTLTLRQPEVRVAIAGDGTANLATLARADASAPSDAAPPAETGATATPPIEIGAVVIEGGAARFVDGSVQPRFSTALSRLDGRLAGLSSNTETRARLALAGYIDGSTPVSVAGELSPLAERPFIDLRLGFRNFGLSQFSPYSSRHIGQLIDRGKLFLDVEYVIDGPSIKGENELFLDQFTLGEKTDSPDALNLPVGLAIALLKDRNGEIHIDLPVRGRTDDPEFSVGGLIFGALGNLITKVALSPFAALGGLGGGDGEELNTVAFAAGSTALELAEQTKLERLASALLERPALALEVAGHAAEEPDRPALQRAALELELRRARYRELQARWFGDKPESVEEVILEPEDRERLLMRRYQETFGEKPVEMLVPTPPPGDESPLADAQPDAMMNAWRAEIERRLAETMTVEPAALRDLARSRAGAVRDHLTAGGTIPAERIFLLDVVVDPAAEAGRPQTELALTTH